MTAFRTDDRVRAVDQSGELAPIYGSVIQVSRFYVFVWYDREDRERLGLPAKADAYCLETGWQSWASEDRWRLQVVRPCGFCGHDISGAGEAHPVLIARINGGNNWRCADERGCLARMDELDARSGLAPLASIWRVPVARLEAAS